jgi:hypothetical protein
MTPQPAAAPSKSTAYKRPTTSGKRVSASATVIPENTKGTEIST